MEKRIVILEDDYWRIQTDTGELSETEKEELKEYFDKVKLPYHLVDGCLCVDGKLDRDLVFERVEHFYDGRAEVYPF